MRLSAYWRKAKIHMVAARLSGTPYGYEAMRPPLEQLQGYEAMRLYGYEASHMAGQPGSTSSNNNYLCSASSVCSRCPSPPPCVIGTRQSQEIIFPLAVLSSPPLTTLSSPGVKVKAIEACNSGVEFHHKFFSVLSYIYIYIYTFSQFLAIAYTAYSPCRPLHKAPRDASTFTPFRSSYTRR